MNPKEIRQGKIHQRIYILRVRYDRCVIFGLTVLSIVLAAGISIIFQGLHLSRTPVVADIYGSVLLRDGADLYVVIGFAAFVSGVIFTIACISLMKKKTSPTEFHNMEFGGACCAFVRCA